MFQNPNANSRIVFEATEYEVGRLSPKEQQAFFYYTVADKKVDDAVDKIVRLGSKAEFNIEKTVVPMMGIVYKVKAIGWAADFTIVQGKVDEVVATLNNVYYFFRAHMSWKGHEHEQQVMLKEDDI